jgi:hypothetical protein
MKRCIIEILYKLCSKNIPHNNDKIININKILKNIKIKKYRMDRILKLYIDSNTMLLDPNSSSNLAIEFYFEKRELMDKRETEITNSISEFLNNPNEFLYGKIINFNQLEVLAYVDDLHINYCDITSDNFMNDVDVQKIFNKSYLKKIDSGIGETLYNSGTILKHYKNEINENIYFTTEGYFRIINIPEILCAEISEKHFLYWWDKYHNNIEEFIT